MTTTIQTGDRFHWRGDFSTLQPVEFREAPSLPLLQVTPKWSITGFGHQCETDRRVGRGCRPAGDDTPRLLIIQPELAARQPRILACSHGLLRRSMVEL